MAEWLERRTRHPEVPGSSFALYLYCSILFAWKFKCTFYLSFLLDANNLIDELTRVSHTTPRISFNEWQ